MSDIIIHSDFQPNTEGVFMIPANVYHNHAMAPEVSRSLVVEMISSCPENVKAIIDGRVQKKVTKEMQSGTLIDLALLEPDKFKEGVSHWIMPEGLNLTTTEGRQWKKDHPGLPALKASTDSPNEASAKDVQGMIEAVMKHKIARRIVESSVKQESAFCYHPDSGILRKCRPDTRLVDNSGRLTLADLKTTFRGGASIDSLQKHCARMAYFVQAPFYADIYRDLIGEEPYFIFFVVERKPPYLVRVFNIDDKGIAAGREMYQRALDDFAKCKSSGDWPPYPEKIVTITMPRWAVTIEEE